MRALVYAFLVAAWALVATSCWVSRPEPEDWLAVGFQTPEQTFRTFQTGLRADLPDLEYRSLSTDFKRRNNVSQALYREFRSQLFRRSPWLKLAGRAKVKHRIELPGGRVRLVAEVDTWLHDETFAVDFAREDFYELWVEGKRVKDDLARWSGLAREQEGKLVVTVPLPGGLPAAEIGQLVAGHEWKIDDFPLSESEDSP
jgi:hypothetical protein